jgi:hypothetical protein
MRRDPEWTVMDPFEAWSEWLLLVGLAVIVETGRGDYVLVLE